MSQKKPSKKSKFLFQRLAKLPTKMALFLLIFYLILGMLIDPRFFARDFRQKYSALAGNSSITVSMRVMGLPGKPIVTAENGTNFIRLDWNETKDTTSYDIYRDTLLLVTGLNVNFYEDFSIEKNTYYTYRVLAKNSGGETFSDELVIFSGDSETPLVPYCTIATIENDSFSGIPKITTSTPSFSGTTNIQNALVKIELNSPEKITATTQANDNGYWSWETPQKLDPGKHQISITATDPDNALVSAETVRFFEILEKSEESSKEKISEKSTSPEKPSPPIQTETVAEEVSEKKEPLTENFSRQNERISQILVFVENENQLIYADDYLLLKTTIVTTNSTNLENAPLNLQYTIFDEKNNRVLDFSENYPWSENQTIQKQIYLSDLFPAGKYKILVRTSENGTLFSGEAFFEVREFHLVNVGSLKLTLSQIMQGLSWIILTLLSIILLFLLLLLLEKYLASRSHRQITEYFLAQRGYFGKRKEVRK